MNSSSVTPPEHTITNSGIEWEDPDHVLRLHATGKAMNRYDSYLPSKYFNGKLIMNKAITPSKNPGTLECQLYRGSKTMLSYHSHVQQEKVKDSLSGLVATIRRETGE
jgi:hypothetical protein